MSITDKWEEKEKAEIIELLREQMKIEGRLVGLYENSAKELTSTPVRHLLHLINLDSRKHIDICHTAIDILQGRDVFKEQKGALIKGLKEHAELEEDSIKRANTMLKSVWIYDNQALKVLIEKLRDDEKRHHNALKKLSEKPFFRIDSRDFTVIIRGEEFAEDRYRKSKEFREKREREKEETG
jgi:rubrerythrin